MRLPFLILTPVSIFLGFATALASAVQINYFDLFLVFVGGVLAHISVNTFNEYYDFRSGLDAKTTKTPFSGGSGALIENPEAVNAVFYVAILSLVLTMLIGIYFTLNLGWVIFSVGVIGVLIIVTYTQWLNRYPFLCLVSPGIGFGPLMVVGTHMILTGEYSMQAFWASLVPFFLVNNLLLLNQFPDIEADKSIGRRHFPIVYGVNKSILLYGVFILAACGMIVVGINMELMPKLSLISLIPIAVSVGVFFGIRTHTSSLQKMIPYLGMNVAVTVLTPLLLGISIILA